MLSGRHVVYLTDLDGNLRIMIGNIDIKSSEEGCFTRPNSVCIDSAGNFIVADANRLQVNKSCNH